MRLNKYIAQAGICSRRKADELTAAGKVKINGAVCRQLGYDVQDGDIVEVAGQTVGKAEKLVYYMLNKPVGYITTNEDEKGRPTATSLLTDVTARVFPVGRLDANTSGLLLLTNDGDFANRVAHPSHRIEKTYIAVVNDHVSNDALWALRNGVDIGGYKTRPAIVNVLANESHAAKLEVKISEGKNRQVRRMFEAVGLKVLQLERIAEGRLQLGRLKPGSYRKLSPAEIEYLRGRDKE